MIDLYPCEIEKPPEAVTLWTLYDHPQGFPGFALRPQFSCKKFDGMERFGRVETDLGTAVVIISGLVWTASDPEQLIEIIPPHCVRIGIGPQDETRNIIGVWME